jgi:two-component system, NarL family, invasion response regulator UvrY
MKKVLVIDDHSVVREGIKEIVSRTPDMSVTDEADNALDGLNKILSNDYDLVLLDISLPDKNGLEVLKEIKVKRPILPVLVLSVHAEEQYAARVLKAGGSGYLTKKSAPEELINAMQKVISGGVYISLSLAESLARELKTGSGKMLHVSLSDREYEVMQLIVSGKTTAEIAEQLKLSVKTVYTYHSRILQKMHIKNNAELLQYAAANDMQLS